MRVNIMANYNINSKEEFKELIVKIVKNKVKQVAESRYGTKTDYKVNIRVIE